LDNQSKKGLDMNIVTNEQVDELASRGVEVFEIAKKVRNRLVSCSGLRSGSYVGISVENGSEILVFKDHVVVKKNGVPSIVS